MCRARDKAGTERRDSEIFKAILVDFEEQIGTDDVAKAQTLQQNHGYHVVVMYYHPSTTGGPTVWDSAATPGLATDFISSSGVIGKSARNVFQTGMKKLWQDRNEDSQSTDLSSTNTIPASTSPSVSFSVSPSFSASSSITLCSSVTTSLPVSSAASTFNPIRKDLHFNTISATFESSFLSAATNTNTNVVTDSFSTNPTLASSSGCTLIGNSSSVSTSSSSSLSSFVATTSVSTISKTTAPSVPTATFSTGTVVALANENGVVCGFGCVSGMSKVHNRPVTPGYLAVFFTSVVPGKTVAPPFPGPFDEDVVRPGESYIWPVDRMFVAGPDDFTHNI
ncbi:mucin-21-like [Xenia sp. Carnegie-2017]|uniref:mucin-21-like n=1 Tax=Xenia sp. Carnegie-2017 TaxID=2897299 RepID=UPI001F040750|nr:mucin-21-like [Xenia sp. Carnegie-2017]